MPISPTRDMGERAHRKSASATGSPTLRCSSSIVGFQVPGTEAMNDRRSVGAAKQTAQEKTPGANAAAARAA